MTAKILTREEVERLKGYAYQSPEFRALIATVETLRSERDALAAKCGRLTEALRGVMMLVQDIFGPKYDRTYCMTKAREALAAQEPAIPTISQSPMGGFTPETSAVAPPREGARERLLAFAAKYDGCYGASWEEQVQAAADLRTVIEADEERDRRLIDAAFTWAHYQRSPFTAKEEVDKLLAAFAQAERERSKP